MLLKKLIYIFILSLTVGSASALEISGKIKLTDRWQPKVFLALINAPEDLFVASPDFIIAETFIQPDGSFVLNTQTVPAEYMFYRLYLVRGNNSLVEFSAAENKNYFHLLLNRDSSVEVWAKTENNSLVVEDLSGSEASNAILDFDKKYREQTKALSGQLTKAKSSFLTQELEAFIHSFVKNSENPLVGLYALYHITDKETDFLRQRDFYFDFQKRIAAEIPATTYNDAYSELLEELVGFRDFVCEMPGVQPKWKDWLLLIEALVIFILLGFTFVFYRKYLVLKKTESQSSANLISVYDGLTLKQQQILSLLAAEKTNKEIANELFVELSTVKTHINNIYRHLGVATRKEAVAFYRRVKGS
ncbi:helix-turn-helix transcriptional regulator [uncultured Draconibacterium sp.]|uniref:helix-turn-helix domain-containing protein n=1 Tax=uncultured Draconibacterium sp. TaxID=1573823 RepID=UPI00326099E8